MPWATARSNAPCAVVSRSGAACTGGCARLCMWLAWLAVLSHSGVLDGGCARQPLCTEPRQCVSGQPWACPGLLQGQVQPMQWSAGLVEPALGAAAGLGRWIVGVASIDLRVCGDFQRRRQHSETTAHRTLPVDGWPALGMSWGTARSNAVSALLSRCGGAQTWGCGRAGQVVCGVCEFANLLRRLPEEEAELSNHSAQSPANV